MKLFDKFISPLFAHDAGQPAINCRRCSAQYCAMTSTASRSIAGGIVRQRYNLHLRVQCPVHRAFVGDFQQALTLVGVKVILDTDMACDAVDLATAGFAFGAVLGM